MILYNMARRPSYRHGKLLLNLMKILFIFRALYINAVSQTRTVVINATCDLSMKWKHSAELQTAVHIASRIMLQLYKPQMKSTNIARLF